MQINRKEKKAEKALTQHEFTKMVIENIYKENLKSSEHNVLIYLTTCYNPKHRDIFPKQKTIALKTNLSESSVIRAIKVLVKKGLILVDTGYQNRYVFTNKLFSLCDIKMTVDSLQNEIELPSKLQPTIHEQKKETKNEQHVVDSSNEKKEAVISIDDFNLLKEYAENKGITNSTAYAKAIIKNGGAEELLDKLKENERIEESAKFRREETRLYLDEHSADLREYIPESVKLKAEELKRKMILNKINKKI